MKYVLKSNQTNNYVARTSTLTMGILNFTSRQKDAMVFTDKKVAQGLVDMQDAGFLRVVKLVPKAKPAPADPLPVASTMAPTQGSLVRVYRQIAGGDLQKMDMVEIVVNHGEFFVIVED